MTDTSKDILREYIMLGSIPELQEALAALRRVQALRDHLAGGGTFDEVAALMITNALTGSGPVDD